MPNILYYLNGPSLSSSTAIFTDAALQTCAPDGYYYDGLVVRQQTSCVLGPVQSCPSCGPTCGTNIIKSNTNGVYYINVNVGAGTGAVAVIFQPGLIPTGIQATYNSVIYNKFNSPTYGLLQGDPNLPTFMGTTANDCGIVAGSPYTLQRYDYILDAFVDSGTTELESVVAGQIQTTVGVPGSCVMIIPKTISTEQTVTVKILSICTLDNINITVGCPTPLPWYNSTARITGVEPDYCNDPEDEYFYFSYPINGSAGLIAVGDYVYTDINGASPLTDGWYRNNLGASKQIYHVTDGIIDTITACP